jgi:hypothetical protein
MSDWAPRQAAREAERDGVREQNVEKANREAKIKGEVGLKLFKLLQDWVGQTIAEYNQLRKEEELVVTLGQADKPKPGFFYDRITVGRRDGRKGPLKIEFSVVTGILHYECGGGQGNFTLQVVEDGQCNFETPYHQVKTIEAIGEEMLSKFMDSQF